MGNQISDLKDKAEEVIQQRRANRQAARETEARRQAAVSEAQLQENQRRDGTRPVPVQGRPPFLPNHEQSQRMEGLPAYAPPPQHPPLAYDDLQRQDINRDHLARLQQGLPSLPTVQAGPSSLQPPAPQRTPPRTPPRTPRPEKSPSVLPPSTGQPRRRPPSR